MERRNNITDRPTWDFSMPNPIASWTKFTLTALVTLPISEAKTLLIDFGKFFSPASLKRMMMWLEGKWADAFGILLSE